MGSFRGPSGSANGEVDQVGGGEDKPAGEFAAAAAIGGEGADAARREVKRGGDFGGGVFFLHQENIPHGE